MAERESPLSRRLNSLLFYLLLITAVGLVSWLSHRYQLQWDWTAGGRNTLSEASKNLLQRLQGPLSVKAFAQDNALLREPVRELIERYRRHSEQISLSFIDPDKEPELTRRLGITVAGQLMLEYQGRSETVTNISEDAVTNAIQRLAIGGERWLGFISGHGERAIDGQANHDLGDFGAELERKGYRVRPLNLAETPDIPANISLLVIAGPSADYLPGELEIVKQHVDNGGNLLWLLDPGKLHGLETLADSLGFKPLPGTIVDINAYALGIQDPAVALITQYPNHPAVAAIDQITLFPHAVGLEITAKAPWHTQTVLQTLSRTWNETGPIRGEIKQQSEAGEKPGPLSLAQLFSREINDKHQRVLVVGDGDFIANAYLGNGANLNLGINLVRWLSGDKQLLDIPAKTAPDLTLELSQVGGAVIAVTLLILMPLGLFGSGFLIWWRRRNR